MLSKGVASPGKKSNILENFVTFLFISDMAENDVISILQECEIA